MGPAAAGPMREAQGAYAKAAEALTEAQVADRLIGVSTQRHLPQYGLSLMGRIVGFDTSQRRFNVQYEDGQAEEFDLAEIAQTLPREHAQLARAWLSARQGAVSCGICQQVSTVCA